MGPLKLSIIMPNYNHAQYISEAFDAIAGQSWKPFEVIICDDASTDNSVEVIEKIVKNSPIVKLLKNEHNIGVTNSVNYALKHVSGDYLYIVSADDKILPGFFEKSMKLLTQYPQAGICSTLSFIMDKQGRRKGFILNPIVSTKPCFFSPEKVRDIFLKQGCWIYGVTSIMRLDYFRANGGYRPELYSFCDGFIEDLLALKYGACFIPEPLTSWRRLGNNYSMTISNKPEIYTKLIENATSLMQTKFSDIFPQEYVEAWRRQNYFYLHYNIYKKISHEKASEVYSLAEQSGFLGRFWAWWLNRLFFLEEALVIWYLFFVFKRSPLRACLNRIRYFFIDCRYRVKERFSGE